MASYSELTQLIDAYINRNGVQAITGQILNGVLKMMVEQLGRGFTIMGAADPTTDPGTPDGPESYFASEVGTYTNFSGLQIVPGELALLCYEPGAGWTKETIYEGFQQVTAQADDNIGVPSVGVSYSNGVLSFQFRNIKGEPGENGQDGQDGQDGDPAGFGQIGADITGGVGTPGVSVESSGPATAKNLQFHFTNLKGETGVTSVLATVDNTSGNPQCAVSLVGQQLTLAFSGLKGLKGDTGVSADYPITIYNGLDSDATDQALAAYQGKVLDGKITQLEAKVAGNLMSSRAKNAILAVFDKVAFAVPDVSAEMTELENALFNLDEIVGITATFTQGDTVVYDQGVDILSDLRSMLVVKAQYGDSAEFPVSDYVLSGELTTGTSTITVTYQGFTDTFTVVVTHYTAQMVFTMADGDVSKFQGSSSTQTSDSSKLGINGWGTQLNRRVFLADSGITPIKQVNGTSTGKYPIPIPRNAKKVTIDITPSNLNNVGVAAGLLENNNYSKKGGLLQGYYDSPYTYIFSESQIDTYRKGGWFFVATAATKSGDYSSSNEPTGITITFE